MGSNVLLSQAPGPGTYDTTAPCVYKFCPPIYSLTSKHFPPEDTVLKPGPGAHESEKVEVYLTLHQLFNFKQNYLYIIGLRLMFSERYRGPLRPIRALCDA